MSDEHVLGALAVLLGVALVAGHRWIAGQMFEAHEQRLRRPAARALHEASQRHSPRWMRHERFELHFARLWLLVAGAACVYIGVQPFVANP